MFNHELIHTWPPCIFLFFWSSTQTSTWEALYELFFLINWTNSTDSICSHRHGTESFMKIWTAVSLQRFGLNNIIRNKFCFVLSELRSTKIKVTFPIFFLIWKNMFHILIKKLNDHWLNTCLRLTICLKCSPLHNKGHDEKCGLHNSNYH